MLNCPWDLAPGMFMPWTYRHMAAMPQLTASAAPRPSSEWRHDPIARPGCATGNMIPARLRDCAVARSPAIRDSALLQRNARGRPTRDPLSIGLTRQRGGVFGSERGDPLQDVDRISQLIVFVTQFRGFFRPQAIFLDLTALIFAEAVI